VETYKFEDVINITRHSQCATCNTYIYTLPCEIEVDFGDFLISVGKLLYPLRKVQMVRINNEHLDLTSRVGRRWLEVKFLRNSEAIKPILEMGLAAYVSEKHNIMIEM